MKKIIIGIVVVLIIIFGVWFVSKNGKSASSGIESASNSETNSTPSQTSLKDLMTSGSPVSCTFTSGEGGYDSAGTIYVSGSKMKGDFTTSNGSVGKIESHMIVDNGTSYVWTSSAPKQGIKMTIDAMDTSEQSTQKPPINYNSAVGYKCIPWAPNASTFNLPTDVTFTDMSAMMKTMPGATGGGGASGCAMCDSLSGDDKSQCRTALQCK